MEMGPIVFFGERNYRDLSIDCIDLYGSPHMTYMRRAWGSLIVLSKWGSPKTSNKNILMFSFLTVLLISGWFYYFRQEYQREKESN